MDLSEAIRGRRATRAFTSHPVSDAVLQKLIDSAIQAPSAVNLQPWHFTVVRNAPLLDRISASSKAHMLAEIKDGRGSQGFQEHLKDPKFHIFYHAPALVVISAQSADWGTEDVAMAAENFMLAAFGDGLGTCWIGFAQRWLATAEGKRSIDVAPDCIPVAPIIVGYPDGIPPAVPRNPPIIRWID
jgi:nitroreductase